jgi:hypothetical protein
MRRSVAALLVLAAIGSAAAAESSLAGFHAPQTEAERALDTILMATGRDDTALDNLLGGRGKAGFRPTIDYRRFVTDALLRAIRDAEAALVKRDCGGAYREGEICGLDYDPLTCAQDSNPRYLYRTETQHAGTARIAYAWPGQPAVAATYRLVLRDGRWKLDGIKCNADVDTGQGDTFNMK